MWERSGCSNTSVSSMLQNSIYQVASSRKFLFYHLLEKEKQSFLKKILAEQSKSELNESTSTVAMASEVWRKFKVDSNKVERWSVNLRTVS